MLEEMAGMGGGGGIHEGGGGDEMPDEKRDPLDRWSGQVTDFLDFS